MTIETINVVERTDVVRSKANKQYFTVTDMQAVKYICFNPSLHYRFEIGSVVTIDYEPAAADKTPAIKSVVDEDTLKDKPIPTPRQQKATGEGDDKIRSVALSYAKDLAVVGKIEVEQIGAYAKRFAEFINCYPPE